MKFGLAPISTTISLASYFAILLSGRCREEMKMGQIEVDEGPPGRMPSKKTPITIRSMWEPKIGDVLTGEFSQPTGEWGTPDYGSTIFLRTEPCVDVPVRVSGRTFVHSLRTLKPRRGDLLRLKRLKKGPGSEGMRIRVERAPQPEQEEKPAA